MQGGAAMKYTWETGEDVFLWWMEDQNVEGQMSLDDFPEVTPNANN